MSLSALGNYVFFCGCECFRQQLSMKLVYCRLPKHLQSLARPQFQRRS